MQHVVATTNEGISSTVLDRPIQALLIPSSMWELTIKLAIVGITIMLASRSQVARLASMVVNSSLGTSGLIVVDCCDSKHKDWLTV
jgi:hypothetical protein